MPAGTRRIIGFDRKISLRWLDATAEWTAQGLAAPAIRGQLERLLDGQVAGEGSHSARGKTMTVLLHVWTAVPDAVAPLRDDGLALLLGRGGRERLPLHWGIVSGDLSLLPRRRGRPPDGSSLCRGLRRGRR